MNFQARQMINDRNNPANNQIIINETDNNGFTKIEYFVSYGVKIVKNLVREGEIILSSKWNYSKTTAKHTYIYFRDFTNLSVYGKDDIEYLIKTGKIRLVDEIN